MGAMELTAMARHRDTDMMILAARLSRTNKGAAAIEYCLVAAAVAMAVCFALATVGAGVNSTFRNASAPVNLTTDFKS